ERRGHLQDLHLPGRLGRNVINEDVLIRFLRGQIAARVIANVVTARKNQQRVAVRTDSCTDGLASRELGRAGQVRVQDRKTRARGGRWSDAHARRQIGGSGGAVVVIVKKAVCFDLK